MWTLKLVISHWPQHRSLAVHIPAPEAIMSEECTRLPKKTPMKITDIMLPGNWRTKWNLLEIMYAGPSQSRALADPWIIFHRKAKIVPGLLCGRKNHTKNRDNPSPSGASYSCVFLPQNGLKTLRSGPFNAGESSQSWPHRIPAKAGQNYMVQHGVLKLNNHQVGIPKVACWRIDSTADEIRISAPSALVAAQRWFCEEKFWRFAVRMVFSRLKCAEQSKIPSIKWPMSILPHIFGIHRQDVPACIFPVPIQNTGSWYPLISPTVLKLQRDFKSTSTSDNSIGETNFPCRLIRVLILSLNVFI